MYSVAEIDGFIDMVRAACDQQEINSTLRQLLSLPNSDRREMIRRLVSDLEDRKAPRQLVQAVACLVSDQVAEEVNKVMFGCR